MRIDVRLPLPAGSSSKPTSDAVAITSPPIAKLASTGELVMIELQGALEFEGLDSDASQLIGTLTFEGPQQSRPILLISHHRLYGKFVDLHQPLAVLQKFQREPPASLDTSPSAKRRWLEQPWTSDVESDGEAGEDGGRRKKARREGAEEPASSSPPPSSPCRPFTKRAEDTATGTQTQEHKKDERERKEAIHSNEDEDDDEEDDDDDDDFGDADDTDDEGADKASRATSGAHGRKKRSADDARKPRVWYDVVCVIRRKILFSQRPEPVVNLAPENGVPASNTLPALVKAA